MLDDNGEEIELSEICGDDTPVYSSIEEVNRAADENPNGEAEDFDDEDFDAEDEEYVDDEFEEDYEYSEDEDSYDERDGDE